MKHLKWILDENGLAVPCHSLDQWGEFFETEREKWHLVDEVEGVRVSTVFLGLDHSFLESAEPVLWETMAFGPDIEEQWRKGITYWDAKLFHKSIVKMYQSHFDSIPPNNSIKPQRTP